MIRSLLLLLLLTPALSAKAEEPVPAGPLTLSQEAPKTAYPATFVDKTVFGDAPKAVSFAMCGVEAHGKESDLDAGLIDLNVPDPANAAGGAIDEGKVQGKDARDFHSSVILGVTLGYRF